MTSYKTIRIEHEKALSWIVLDGRIRRTRFRRNCSMSSRTLLACFVPKVAPSSLFAETAKGSVPESIWVATGGRQGARRSRRGSLKAAG